MKKPAKIRLRQRDRDMLRSFAKKHVKAPDEEAKMNAIYDQLAPQVTALVEARYPPKDMAILKKYEQATPDSCIRISCDGIMHEFKYRSGDNLPLVPGTGGYHGCRQRVYLGDGQLGDEIMAYNNAVEAHDEAVKAKLRAYDALIINSTTLEEVLEFWPAAEALRENIMQDRQAVTIISPDVLEVIKADNAGAENHDAR